MNGDNGSTSLRSVTRALSLSEEYPVPQAHRLSSRFDLRGPLETADFPDKGNINQHTFLVFAGRGTERREYLLQRINQQVFTRPWSVMSSMIACIRAQRESLSRGGLRNDEEWETITLIPTRDGSQYLETDDRRGYGCWRMMVKIPETRTFKSLGQVADPTERLRIAEQAGSGLAMYGGFTSAMETAGLENPLPGYRDTRNYYNQLFSVLSGAQTLAQADSWLPRDPTVRQSTQAHFLLHIPREEFQRRVTDPEVLPLIELARREEGFAMTLLREMEEGRIRTVAIHGDTKLDNFLFSTRTGRVRALVDLDTIMPHSWLVDWGDMVRSLVNVAGEKERDLGAIRVDVDVFEAVARGFFRSARDVRPAEIDRMVDAVQIIALELGVRFLTDYLRGDSYFRLSPADPPDLNKIRARAQLTLFERLREKDETARALIDRLRAGADPPTASEERE